MSRETDSSSSGPQGRGGAAYPSGTPPYGTRQYPSPRPQEEPRVGGVPGTPATAAGGQETPEPAPAEPKTETTLTTRIRINIPGSRPIPPVVVRTPVSEGAEGESGQDDSASASASGRGSARANWTPQGASSPADGAAAPRGTEAAQTGTGGADKGGAGASDWFAPRKPVAPAAQPAARQKPATPPGGSAPGAGGPGSGQPNIPYLDDSPGAPGSSASGDPLFPGAGPAASGLSSGSGDPLFPGAAPSASGSGDPVFPGAGSPASSPEPFGGRLGGDGGAGEHGPLGGPPPGSVPFPGFPSAGGAPDIPEVPSGPTTGPVTGGMYMPSAAAEARDGAASDGLADHVSGDTLVSGIPAVTAPVPPAAPKPPAGSDGGGKSKPSAKAARKGRSKVALAGIAVLAVAGVAYAAGLLMDHADVPTGTTVLGVDIGGKTRDEAVKALDAAVGDRGTAPITVHIGNQDKQLKPELAGLSIDTRGSVSQVAHRDYNPISVIGSLFGGKHVVAPTVNVDQEKLRSQLQTLSPSTGGSDGMVKFVDGKPVGVPGTPYQAVDADASVQKITAAYTQRAETGKNDPVDLAVTTHQPQVTQAQLNEAIKNIGDPAMSGKITVTAGTHSVLFSPQKSLSKILTIVPVPGNGKMTLHIDLAVLRELYGNAFDGVLLERGIGTKTPVTPQDVASAMLPALAKTAPEKTAVIQNVAN
ncbi:hypothetical protein [Streptomyces sp. RPT161]|uniref:hypothetical protein n=1 Tax=Streptomyces sp. RPT161 TaxID=3015993 RepID=UPI0022B88B9A|nr:hypothetical protein [Streptomyces sp. RPT161]